MVKWVKICYSLTPLIKCVVIKINSLTFTSDLLIIPLCIKQNYSWKIATVLNMQKENVAGIQELAFKVLYWIVVHLKIFYISIVGRNSCNK